MIKTEPLYSCIACNCQFQSDDQYKTHYKSQFHRYNLKRKLINLPAVEFEQFEAQFQANTTKSTTESEIRCEICSKTFMSKNTYTQHTNSLKHKNNRKKITQTKEKSLSKNSSSSKFSVISCTSEQTTLQECLFCKKMLTPEHLEQHSFPPFKQSCSDLKGLTEYVRNIIDQRSCVYCCAQFSSPEATKQHMMDVGHMMINTDNFDEFERFYTWVIKETDSESQEWEQIGNRDDNDNGKITLKDVELNQRNRIKVIPMGARIKNKNIGLRAYRQFYKQYYRNIQEIHRKTQLAITDNDSAELELKQEIMHISKAHKHASRAMTNLQVKSNKLNVYAKSKNF